MKVVGAVQKLDRVACGQYWSLALLCPSAVRAPARSGLCSLDANWVQAARGRRQSDEVVVGRPSCCWRLSRRFLITAYERKSLACRAQLQNGATSVRYRKLCRLCPASIREPAGISSATDLGRDYRRRDTDLTWSTTAASCGTMLACGAGHGQRRRRLIL